MRSPDARTRSASSRCSGGTRRRSRCSSSASSTRACRWARWSRARWALPIAVLVGKPVGILLGAGVASLAGLHLPHRVGWRDLIVVGFIAAIGFSVGLFFCAALIPPGQLRSEISMGVLLTVAGLPLALLAARVLGVGRFAR